MASIPAFVSPLARGAANAGARAKTPAPEPRQARPTLSIRQRAHDEFEFSFTTLFLDQESDRIECAREWLKWLPSLAAKLLQLSLANISDDMRRDRALLAIRTSADPCAADLRYGRPILHWACLLARPDLVELLLQNGAIAQLNQPDGQGHSPLDCTQALRTDLCAASVVRVLLAAGASLDTLPKGGVELLYLADLDEPLAKHVLQLGVPADGGDACEVTPLATACDRGLWDVASVLLDYGADIRRRGPNDTTALHHGSMPVWLAEQLYLRGANVNACDLTSTTPLMLACQEGNIPLVRWLIDRNARLDAVSDNGRSVEDYANFHGGAVAGWLRQQMGAVAAAPTE